MKEARQQTWAMFKWIGLFLLVGGAVAAPRYTVNSSSDIRDGVIKNADVNASAAIAWTKISKTGSNLTDLSTRLLAGLTDVTISASEVNSYDPTGRTLNHVARSDGANGLVWGLPVEADTLATVTGRGASTATASAFTGGLGVGVTPGAASFFEVDRPDLSSDSERISARVSSVTQTLSNGATLALGRQMAIIHNVYNAASGTATVTDAATLYLDSAPTGGAGVTLTNPYTIWVDNGTTRLDGNLVLLGTNPGATKIMGTDVNGVVRGAALSGLSWDGTTLANTGLTSNPTLNAVTTAGNSTANSISTGAITAPSITGSGSSVVFDGTVGIAADASSATNKTFLVANSTHLAGNAQWRGTATVPSASTSVSVSFGFAWPSAPAAVVLTPKSDPAVRYWVTSISTTGFTITTNAAPGADTDFMWIAIQ